jgi:hypothetical protein
MRRWNFGIWLPFLVRSVCVIALIMISPLLVHGQQASVSAWKAANFRIWGYIPYWDDSKITSSATISNYAHVSDVLFFGSARPDATGRTTPFRFAA